LADLDDQHQEHLILHAEQQAQVADPHAVELIGGLQAYHIGMAGRFPEAMEFSIHPSLQHRIQAAVGLGG
jgi:hypothetical protein